MTERKNKEKQSSPTNPQNQDQTFNQYQIPIAKHNMCRKIMLFSHTILWLMWNLSKDELQLSYQSVSTQIAASNLRDLHTMH